MCWPEFGREVSILEAFGLTISAIHQALISRVLMVVDVTGLGRW